MPSINLADLATILSVIVAILKLTTLIIHLRPSRQHRHKEWKITTSKSAKLFAVRLYSTPTTQETRLTVLRFTICHTVNFTDLPK